MTETIIRMSETHPDGTDFDREALAHCIAVCLECAQSCTACADACLGEDEVAELVTCIRRNLDCADVCATTAKVLSRHAGGHQAVLKACAEACQSCAEECERHSMHEHCTVCAEVCRRCEEACNRLAGTAA